VAVRAAEEGERIGREHAAGPGAAVHAPVVLGAVHEPELAVLAQPAAAGEEGEEGRLGRVVEWLTLPGCTPPEQRALRPDEVAGRVAVPISFTKVTYKDYKIHPENINIF
jgi:hypothetical protein